jgi:GntR family transcriptional regulator
MSLDPTDPRPPYQQLADQLRSDILSGRLQPGQLIPSVRLLAQQYGVSNVTANRAIEALQTEGLIDTQLGRGTFVRTKKPTIRVDAYLTATPDGTRATWRGEGERQGFQATQEITEVATIPGPDDVTERLELDRGAPTVVRRRVLRADGVPVQLSDSYYPAALAAGTELTQPRKLPGYTYNALTRLGVEPDRFRDELHLRMPTPAEAQILRLGKGIPVLRVLRTTYTVGGRPVEVADQLLAGDRYVLTYELPAKPPNVYDGP